MRLWGRPLDGMDLSRGRVGLMSGYADGLKYIGVEDSELFRLHLTIRNGSKMLSSNQLGSFRTLLFVVVV